MYRTCVLVGALLLGVAVAGCRPSMREEQIDVKESNDPLNAPRTLLQRYADGQPMGSEATSFAKMVEDVRKVDAARADVLEKGLAEIEKAPPGKRPALAKALLQKIQPSMK